VGEQAAPAGGAPKKAEQPHEAHDDEHQQEGPPRRRMRPGFGLPDLDPKREDKGKEADQDEEKPHDQPPQPQPCATEREEGAQKDLELAKQLLDKAPEGERPRVREVVRQRLKALIRAYPDTAAAGQAKQLLDKLE
jgi:hypothetical protein